MFESWYELAWHVAYLAIFAASMGIARGGNWQLREDDVEEDDKRLDIRRRQGGHTFNTILKRVRAGIEERENRALDDVVRAESAEAREMAAEDLLYYRGLKEDIDRLLTMKDPGR